MSFESYHKLLSPCKSECNLSGDNGRYCDSCFRLKDEIVAWRTYTEEECLKVLAKLAVRKKSEI